MRCKTRPTRRSVAPTFSHAVFPLDFHLFSIVSLALGGVCTLIVLVDIVRHPQRMGVMNVVWPVSALFGTVVVVWAYFSYGRRASETHRASARTPFPAVVGMGTLHCGAGCTIGDVAAEWLAFLVPAVAVGFGWHSLFDDKMVSVWILDFVFAFVLGIVFQYFAIVPMRGLEPGEGIVAALKADALSLAAWQVGMYGVMALAQLVVLPHLFGRRAEVDEVEFWFTMQLAMLAGFVTAYPVNWWLIRTGIKEQM